ncbi:MAG: DUF1523 family protein [Cypionkella sp.]|jgi:hypothetical protein
MNKIKWGFRILLLVIVGLFLHYTLPHHDVVRITNTYNRLTTVGTSNSWAYSSPDSGTAESTATRDIRFIEAAFPDGSVIVYRNEDTGWVWPPYFKYDSSNLQAEAGNLKSLASAPTWVSVTYYGWRFPFLSIYPNAVAVKEVAGPDVTIIPYVPIIVLIFLLFIVIMLRRIWAQFVERTVEPTLAGVEETWDGVEERAERAKGRAGSWLNTWRKKK